MKLEEILNICNMPTMDEIPSRLLCGASKKDAMRRDTLLPRPPTEPASVDEVTRRVDLLEEIVLHDRTQLREMQLQLRRLNEAVQHALQSLVPKIDVLLSKESTDAVAVASSQSSAGGRPLSAPDALSLPDSTVPENTPDSLHTAAKSGDADLLFRLLEAGANVRQRNKHGDTALHLAAGYGHERCVVLLLGAGLAPDVPGRRRRTPLHCAAGNGHLGTMRRLLSAGARVDVRDADEDTPLILSAKKGFPSTVSALLQAGASASATDKDGRTPAMVAAHHGHCAVLRLLMHDPSLSDSDAHGDTALLLAAKAQHWDVVELLALTGGANLDARDRHGHTALMMAARAEQWSVMRSLLQRGASTVSPKGSDKSPLLLAVENGREEEIRALLRHGAATSGDEMKLALTRAREASVVWAFEDEVPGTLRGEIGRWAMRQAAQDGNLDTLTVLLDAGVDPNSAGTNGAMALHCACYGGQLACVKALLGRGADKDARDNKGLTALHDASRQGELECARLLLASGADASVKDKEGKTAMDLARTDAVRQLIRKYLDA